LYLLIKLENTFFVEKIFILFNYMETAKWTIWVAFLNQIEILKVVANEIKIVIFLNSSLPAIFSYFFYLRGLR